MSVAGLLAVLMIPAASAAGLSEARRWACFYGEAISQEAWGSLDMVVLDPDNFGARPSSGPVALAYVSVGEADERRAYWPQVQGRPFVVEPNPDWPSDHRVDLRDRAWRKLLLETVVPGALEKGYAGVMLDTIDTAEYFESSAPARFAGSMDAAVALVAELRAKFPKALIVVNNGLTLLDRIGPQIDGVLVEDLYTYCMPGSAPCGPSSRASDALKEPVLKRFAATGKPVFLLVYSRLGERRARWVRAAVSRARANGFRPYLTTPTLERFGVVDPR